MLVPLALTLFLAADPAAARIAAWKGDLQVIATELPKRHKNAFFKTSRDAFSSEVKNLEAGLPGLGDDEVKVALIRLVAGLGDTHTAVEWKREDFSLLPVRLARFAEGWFVTSVAGEENKVALGQRVLRLGDTEIEDAAERIRRLIACENPSCYLAKLPDHLGILEFLRAEKVVSKDKPPTLALEDDEGARSTLELKAVAGAEQKKLQWTASTYPSAGPEHALRLDKQNVNYWYTYVPGSKMLYFAYNRCQEQDGLPIKDFTKDLLAFVDSHEVDKLVIDLRRNGGGNEGLLRPLIPELKKREAINRKGHLFVIMGRGTFSSAAQNAMELKEKAQAITVGEPTGQKPNHYGEVKELHLPHWGVDVGYSTTFWKRVDGDPEAFVPDVAAPPSFEAIQAGRDPAMEAVLRFQDGKTP
jgi:hypothetical protein